LRKLLRPVTLSVDNDAAADDGLHRPHRGAGGSAAPSSLARKQGSPLSRQSPQVESLAGIPWLGDWLQELIDRVSRDPKSLPTEIGRIADQSLGEIRTVVGGLGRNVAKTFFALLTAFFMYRNGEQFARQVREVMHQLLGTRVDDYMIAIGDTTRAVVYGLVLAALAQGILAGLAHGWLDCRPRSCSAR
jgi:predicted PurR-regulated permease PerM